MMAKRHAITDQTANWLATSFLALEGCGVIRTQAPLSFALSPAARRI